MFELTLKNDRIRKYQLMSWIIVLLNVLVLLGFTSLPEYEGKRFAPFAILALAFILFVVDRGDKYNFLKRKKNIGTLMFVICVAWFVCKLYWIAAANFVLDLLYLYAVRKFQVLVTEYKITYPSFPKRKIEWNELANVIAKDGILTIDFKNNTLLQSEIEGEDYFNEKKFNDFCNKQLVK